MILHPLQFEWKVNEQGDVGFTVCEHPAHIIHMRYYSKGRIPPMSERVKYARHLGKSDEIIKNMIKNHKLAEKNSDKNQAELDAVFARFNIKPTKKKVLKPVKKN